MCWHNKHFHFPKFFFFIILPKYCFEWISERDGATRLCGGKERCFSKMWRENSETLFTPRSTAYECKQRIRPWKWLFLENLFIFMLLMLRMSSDVIIRRWCMNELIRFFFFFFVNWQLEHQSFLMCNLFKTPCNK